MKPKWTPLIVDALMPIERAHSRIRIDYDLDVRRTELLRSSMNLTAEGLKLLLDKAYYLGQQDKGGDSHG